MRSGLEQLVATPRGADSLIEQRRFALLMNEASVDSGLQYACDVLDRRFPTRLKALLTPQHGMWGEQQANMIETGHTRHPRLGLPVWSLYSSVREPTKQMLDGIDCLLIDLQDVGCRVYTFIWTITNCLRACAERSIEAVVLDRVNPLGSAVRGPTCEPEFFSFVGMAPMPLQHGLTIGELTQVVNDLLQIGAQVSVVPVTGWQRREGWPGQDHVWVPPSPNLPTVESVRLYPGLVLLEGTNISEGRGTTTPFQVVGAPWIDEFQLVDRLRSADGVRVRPTRFQPTFDKYAGQSCGGVFLHPTDENPDSVALAVDVMSACAELWPDEFSWNPPPYEYETQLMPIDILFGTSKLRSAIDTGSVTASLLSADELNWQAAAEPYLLYGKLGVGTS